MPEKSSKSLSTQTQGTARTGVGLDPEAVAKRMEQLDRVEVAFITAQVKDRLKKQLLWGVILAVIGFTLAAVFESRILFGVAVLGALFIRNAIYDRIELDNQLQKFNKDMQFKAKVRQILNMDR